MTEKEYKLEQWTDNSLYYSFPNGNLHHSISNVLTRVEKDLNALHEEKEELIDALNQRTEQCDKLYEENQSLKDKYERKDRQLKRTKKDIEKYTDYFMNELNWDCDRIIKEVFK